MRHRIFGSNSYVCPTSPPGSCVLIDAGLDGPAIADVLGSAGLRPQAIFCTHGHFDHVGSTGELQREFGIPVYLHRGDARTASGSNFLMMALKIPARIALPEFELIDDGFTMQVGDEEIRYLHVPGHTPGSCVVLFRGVAFTGDTMYRDGVGLSSLPGEDSAVLSRSLLALWDTLSDETLVNPGHGGSASFGEIKQHNVALRRFLGFDV